MMRRAALFLFAIVAFSGLSAAPARAACPPIPGIQQVCEIALGNDFLTVVTSRVRIYVDSFLAQLRFTANQKVSQAESINAQVGALHSVEAQAARDSIPAIQGPRCIVLSAGQIAVRGPSVTCTPTTAPENAVSPALDGGKSTSCIAQQLPGLKSLLNSDGTTRSVTAMLHEQTDNGTVDPQVRGAQYVARVLELQAAEQNNLTAASNDPYRYVLSRYNERMRNYGPSQSVKQFQDADVMATTILGNDVLPLTLNQPDVANFPATTDKNGKPTEIIAPVNMEAAATTYCQNIIVPTVLAPNRGQAAANSADRKAYAVERSGWNARLSLARQVCEDAVARRLQFKVKPLVNGKADNAVDQPIFKIIADRQEAFCKARKSADSKFLCDNDPNGTSEFQMNKVLYSEFFTSLVVAHMDGAANVADSLHALVQMDELSAILNFRIYEMQEKLNLLKAAQLAQQIDSNRTGPNAAAPTQ